MSHTEHNGDRREPVHQTGRIASPVRPREASTTHAGRTAAARRFAALCTLCLALLALSPAPATASLAVTFGAGETEGPSGVAVDNSTELLDSSAGDVYVADGGTGGIDKFGPTGTFLLAFGEGLFSAVAVDDSTNPLDPSKGDIYVSDISGDDYRIEQFTPAGGLERTFGSPGTGPGQFSAGFNGGGYPPALPLAVDASGNVWVGDVGRIEEFSPEGHFTSEVRLAGVARVNSLAIDTDPSSPSFGDFYLSDRLTGAPADEKQLLTTPASGTYTLTFEGQSTGPLPFNATDAEIQGALAALSTIGPGNISASPAEHGQGVVLEFEGTLADANLPLLAPSAGSVTMQEEGRSGHLLKVGPDGTRLATLDETGHPATVGVDPATGDVFLVDTPPGPIEKEHTLLEYGPSGTELESFGSGEVLGSAGAPRYNALAFGDAAERLYLVSNEAAQIFTRPPAGPLLGAHSLAAGPIRTTTVTLGGTLEPEGTETKYHFQYITQAAYKENLEKGHAGFEGAAKTPEELLPADFAEHPVSAALTALAPETSYRFCLSAESAKGDGTAVCSAGSDEGIFTTLPPLVIAAQFAAAVTSTTATLTADIDPLGVAGEYRFEYITEAAYQHAAGLGEEPFAGCDTPANPGCQTTPEAALEPVEAIVAVQQHVEALQPDGDYRYRVLAHNHCNPSQPAEVCTAKADAGTFTTQRASTPGESTLPDGRQWELVSPAERHGGSVEPIDGELNLAIQAAAGGGAITYDTTAPLQEGAAGNSNFSQIYSWRTPAGWSSTNVSPPHLAATGIKANIQEYRLFSSDLSLGLLAPFGAFDPAISAQASAQTPFLRESATGTYTPLVTGAPGFANVPEGTEFGVQQGGAGQCPPNPQCGPEFLGATADFSHIVISSRVPLVEGAPQNALYEWSVGHLQLVSILPGGAPDSAADQPRLGQFEVGLSVDVRGAISADGSRVVFSDKEDTNLYLHELPSGETVRLDVGTGSGHAHFQAASSDDSRIFFSENGDLYECEVMAEPGDLHCQTSDLGPLQGTMIGASQDGSYAYYASGGNLELDHEGTITTVAALSADDIADWAGSNTHSPLPALAARVSPDGRWLAFSSDEPLTGYDNHDAQSGQPDEEIFLYHTGEGAPGSLICASCNPTGERPHGVPFSTIEPGLAGGHLGLWESDQWVAASMPPWSSDLYQSRYLSNQGRLFFDSSDALVPQDTNATEDVYEYEPPQSQPEPPPADSCTTGSPTYSPGAVGCISLISSGTSTEESAFLDASETGEDVYFLSTQKLVPQDLEGSLVVYDAHSCTSASPCPPAPAAPTPACAGDSCQATSQPPEDLTPSSLTYQGPGNPTPPPAIVVKPKTETRAQKLAKALRVCRADKRKKRRETCEKAARKAYGAKASARKPAKGKRATSDRRSS